MIAILFVPFATVAGIPKNIIAGRDSIEPPPATVLRKPATIPTAAKMDSEMRFKISGLSTEFDFKWALGANQRQPTVVR